MWSSSRNLTVLFADLPAEQFIEDWLVRKLNVKFLSIGDDFKFGAKRLGNFAMLQQAGKSSLVLKWKIVALSV